MDKSPIYALTLAELEKATKSDPVTKDRLRDLTGLSDRDVRDVIKALRDSGVRVATSSGSKGYWLCRGEEDYRILRSELLSRAAALHKTVAAMDATTPGQVSL